MILRRGMSALVPAGAPYFGRQAPLVPTIINTIAGRAFEGGKYGVTRNVLGTNPVLRGSRMRRRGMGDVTYCSNNPPSGSQAAYLAANGIAYSIVDCGGTATPQGTNLGNQPITTIANPNTAPLVAPVYQAPTGIEDCVAMGLATSAGQACVARNTARAVAAENAHIANNQQYQTQLCIANGGGGWVPAGQDVGQWCAGHYGGSVTSGYVPIVSSGSSGTSATPPASGAAVVPSAGAARLSFQNLTNASTSQFQVGDKWIVSITGAAPEYSGRGVGWHEWRGDLLGDGVNGRLWELFEVWSDYGRSGWNVARNLGSRGSDERAGAERRVYRLHGSASVTGVNDSSGEADDGRRRDDDSFDHWRRRWDNDYNPSRYI